MTEILYHFLLHLGWGMLATMPLVPARLIGRGYYVVNTLCALGVWMVALSIHTGGDLGKLDWWLAGAVGAVMLSFMLDPTVAPRPSLAFVGVALVLAAIGIHRATLPLTGEPFYASSLYLGMTFLVSSVLAGGTLVAMILGHYYLVNPGLSFGFLGRFTKLLAVALGLRFVLALIPALSADLFARPPGVDESMFFIDHLAFLLQRGLTLVALVALLPMIADCVKRRANQSATGLLYVASFLALMGEGVATYFAVAYRLPI